MTHFFEGSAFTCIACLSLWRGEKRNIYYVTLLLHVYMEVQIIIIILFSNFMTIRKIQLILFVILISNQNGYNRVV